MAFKGAIAVHLKTQENTRRKYSKEEIDLEVLNKLKQLSTSSKYILRFQYEIIDLHVSIIEPKEEVILIDSV